MYGNRWFGGPVFCGNQECLGASLLELFKGEPFHKKINCLGFYGKEDGRGEPLIRGGGSSEGPNIIGEGFLETFLVL